VGHLLVATDVLEQLSLDRILLIPNFVQPLKGKAEASAKHRLEMVRLLAGDSSYLQVESMEVDREGVSYTVETLERLAQGYPGARLFFVIGPDALETLSAWKEPARIQELATLAVVTRELLRVRVGGGHIDDASAIPAGAITVATRTIDISSSEIRERVRRGKPIRGFVTPEVELYISEHGLYRQAGE